jgi:molybdopterin converting factor small subunit
MLRIASMKVTVEYAAQIKQAAGRAAEELEIEPSTTVQDLALQLAERHGAALRQLLLSGDGGLSRSILLFVGNEQVRPESPHPLRDRDVVTILSPISGG